MSQQQYINGKPVIRMLPSPVQQPLLNVHPEAARKPHVAPVPNRFRVNTGAMTRTKTPIVDNQNTTTNVPTEPTVYFSQSAMAKMKHIVATCALEVGWMALVKNPAPAVYLVYEVFVPTQTVTAVETDIDGAAMAELAMDLMDAGHDTSELYGWFHSHVNMGVSPSAQDERQVEEFLESCPVFIRGIMNKRGELKVDVYYTEHNIAYTSVPTQVFLPPLTADALAALDAEIASKVTERRYIQPAYTGGVYGGNYGHRDTGSGLRDFGQKKTNRSFPSGPSAQLSQDWGDTLTDEADIYSFGELTELNDDAPMHPRRANNLSKMDKAATGFGEDWDESTPLHLRPQGWSMDEDYLAEGKAFDLFVN